MESKGGMKTYIPSYMQINNEEDEDVSITREEDEDVSITREEDEDASISNEVDEDVCIRSEEDYVLLLVLFSRSGFGTWRHIQTLAASRSGSSTRRSSAA